MNNSFDAATFKRLRGLLRLAEAAAEAETVNVDKWQYAVPIDVLRNHSGLTNADVRRLVQERLAEHRVETTREGARKRAFRRAGPLNPAGRPCFVVSRGGLALAQRVCESFLSPASPCHSKPYWDAKKGLLTLNGLPVKALRADAVSLRRILKQCEDEEWADEITNPFADMPPKRRSHYLGQLLTRLNRGQQGAHVHFSAIKKGRFICWKIVEGA